MARFGMVIDVNRCNGCFSCFLACRDEFAGNDYLPYSAAQPLSGQSWMQVKEVERGSYPKTKVSYVPIPCMQCEKAPCMEAAVDGAVYRRQDGIVIVDPEKAKGQKEIVKVCPYRVIFWNEEKSIPQKCTFCAHLLDEGAKEPRCVESCPTGAILFGDIDDPRSEVSMALAAAKAEEFHPEFRTDPTVQYANLPKRFIAGEVVLADRQGECARGVSMALEGDDLKVETVTSAFGDFEFEGLEKNAQYRVVIKHDGYAGKVMDVVTRTDVNLGAIVLEPVR